MVIATRTATHDASKIELICARLSNSIQYILHGGNFIRDFIANLKPVKKESYILCYNLSQNNEVISTKLQCDIKYQDVPEFDIISCMHTSQIRQHVSYEGRFLSNGNSG